MTWPHLLENVARAHEAIAEAQGKAGIAGAVRVVAVTKGHPAAAVIAASEAGIADVGENRVQDALEKQGVVGDRGLRWHLIGHLQTNKAKFVPGRFTLVHSVDSLRVGEALARGVAAGTRLGILLQVNVAGEAQKSGCAPDEAPEVAHRLVAVAGLELRGLMTLAPFTEEERTQRKVFGDLRRLRDRLAEQGLTLPELSMGMSGDFQAAVAEGATIVRLGTILFGQRAV